MRETNLQKVNLPENALQKMRPYGKKIARTGEILLRTGVIGGVLFLSDCAPTITPHVPSVIPVTPVSVPVETMRSTSIPGTGTGETIVNPDLQNRAAEAFSQEYRQFVSRYVLDGGNSSKRVIYDPDKQNSSSEVNAYGMICALFANDKATFDGLWSYTKQYMNSVGLPSWLIDSRGIVTDTNSVFDANEDIVFALLAADAKWGNTGKEGYKDSAIQLLNNIMLHNIESDTFIPKGGDSWGGSGQTDPSYFDPYYYSVFSRYDQRWNNVLTASEVVMDKVNRNILQGRMSYYSDWVNASGEPVSGPDNIPPSIRYDMTRIPLRQMKASIALSNNHADHARQQLIVANNFFQPIISRNGEFDIDRLKDGYRLDGTVTGQYSKTAFASAAAVAAMMSDSANYKNYMYEQLLQLPTDYPYNDYIKLLALLTLSGKFHY